MKTPAKSSYWEDEIQFTGKYQKTVLQTLWWAYRAYKVPLILCFLLGFVGRFLLLANANLLGYWADSLCHQPDGVPGVCKPIPTYLQGLSNNQFMLLLMALTTVGFIMTLYFRIGFSRISAKAVSQLHDEVVLRTSRFPMSFFDSTPAGRVIVRFSSDYGNVFRLFGGPLAEFIAIIYDLAAMIILISLAGWIFLPSVGVIAVFYYLVYRANRNRLRLARRDLSVSRAPAISHFAETAQGASTIRTFLKESEFFNRFSKLNDGYLSQRLRTSTLIFMFSYQMNVLTALLMLTTGVLASYFSHSSLISLGSVGVAFSFVALSGNTVQMFFEWMAQFEEAMVGVERLDNYLRKEIEPGHALPTTAKFATNHYRSFSPPALNAFPQFTAGAPVVVKDLWFRYKPHLPWVLKNVHFQLTAGERLGIIGRTGSGKSSLIQALFYLYPLNRGEISVGGFTPFFPEGERAAHSHQVDLFAYRELIALITQDPVLFRAPLRENLTLNPAITDAQCRSALARVGLGHWVEQLPLGLQHPIEEKGRNLSSGEKQLICMARCLLQNTPLVIMDEATSQVDPQSEEILNRATEEVFKGRTLIIIAHRLSTLRICDKVLWLENGDVMQFGPTDAVLKAFLETKNAGDELKNEIT